MLVGGGSGMSPVWSILSDHLASGENAPGLFLLRRAYPRTICSISTRSRTSLARYPDVTFIPVLSHAEDGGWTGDAASCIQSRATPLLKELGVDGDSDVYACGPPPMIDARACRCCS